MLVITKVKYNILYCNYSVVRDGIFVYFDYLASKLLHNLVCDYGMVDGILNSE